MDKDETYYIDLIARYLDGEATHAEERELVEWVNAGPENKRIFEEYRQTWLAIETSRIETDIDTEAEWNKFKLKSGLDAPRTFSPGWYVRAAAIFLLIAIPAAFIIFRSASPKTLEVVASAGVVNQSLPDGSMVTLNTGSSLHYPASFRGKQRKVTLTGEACFEVTHNTSKPFVIAAGQVNVEVLGTVFYVNTNIGNGACEVALISGSVKVTATGSGEERYLDPGEKAMILNGQVEISKNQDENMLAWKTHKLVFDNDPLEMVASAISKMYGVEVILENPALADCRLTATFDEQSLASVLHVLSATLGIETTTSGKQVIIKGTGCK